ncbi:hypothetical protein BCV69DRAFT_163895 [Microstroma glucosiphilum]|uniref:Uncharacterized protein n=1 Tax=Pseudomicrostroma glucosiphilum TaxID=1684307 RepID=A0A316U9T0_9BASI|nr:hypothetical protein BCV69DRAFT_163895 [Pseudomicrostroma glucosiphilum]PWN21241.1 hypothetical protein BCV69DRAFT_163895 [Pseudomicrostroma glucosiphilum]
MVNALSHSQANANVTLSDGVSSLLAYFNPKIITAPVNSEIAIAVLTGIMTLLTPLVYLRLWNSGTLWFFRLTRSKGSGTSIVTHPLNVFSSWLAVTGMLVLASVCLKFRFRDSSSIGPLQAYMAVVLASWIALPFGAMNTILGTTSALAGSTRDLPAGSTWESLSPIQKASKVLSSRYTVNIATVAAPLVWLGCTLPFLMLAQIYLRRSLKGLAFLQAAVSVSDAPTAAMTAPQLDTLLQAGADLRRSFWYVGILALVWAIFVTIEFLVLSLVGLRVLLVLSHQLTILKRLQSTTDSSDDMISKRRYIYESIIVLGGFYSVIAVSGLAQIAALAFTTHGLWQWNGSGSLERFRIGNLIYQWIIAVNGLGVMLLVSGRVHAAVTADTSSRRLSTVSARNQTKVFAADRDDALKGY